MQNNRFLTIVYQVKSGKVQWGDIGLLNHDRQRENAELAILRLELAHTQEVFKSAEKHVDIEQDDLDI